MKAKILINDKTDRFKAGEIGELIEHDSDKYDYFVDLGILKNVNLCENVKAIDIFRRYYFHKDEVEIIDD